MASKFAEVELRPHMEMCVLHNAYLNDTDEKKVNLAIGVYRTEEGNPWELPVVFKTEQLIANDEERNFDYLPSYGCEKFTYVATKLLLGEESTAVMEGRTISFQSVSGTGALRLGAEFLARYLNYTTCYFSNPASAYDKLPFTAGGFKEQKEYRYWDEEKLGLNYEGLIEDLNEAPENSVIFLSHCAHNPTGCDPTEEQWMKIAEVMKEKKLFPFFDLPYQGFASGDVDKDAWVVRYFVDQGLELMCAQSFSHNFGLYDDRVGNLIVVVQDINVILPVINQLEEVVSGMYINPPNHGALIVTNILSNPELLEEWKESVRAMYDRTMEMRRGLKERLVNLNTPGSWDHLTDQTGLNFFSGLTASQVQRLVNDYHIYLAQNGRISIYGLNSRNLDYVAQSIYDAVTNTVKFVCVCKKGAVAAPEGEPEAVPEAEPEAVPA